MVKVGDIFVATWGYEQTNADFFQVIKLTTKGVVVRHIKSKDDMTGETMTGSAVPIPNAFDGNPKTKRLRQTSYGDTVFNAGEIMGSAELWDGNPVSVSNYG